MRAALTRYRTRNQKRADIIAKRCHFNFGQETYRIIDTQSVRVAFCHVLPRTHVSARTCATRDDAGDLISGLSAACQSWSRPIDGRQLFSPSDYLARYATQVDANGGPSPWRWGPSRRNVRDRPRVIKVSHVPWWARPLFFNGFPIARFPFSARRHTRTWKHSELGVQLWLMNDTVNPAYLRRFIAARHR